jgi:Flp pilus assembly protein TadB
MTNSAFQGWIAIGVFFCVAGVVGLLLGKYSEGAFALLIFVPVTIYLVLLLTRQRRAERRQGSGQ